MELQKVPIMLQYITLFAFIVISSAHVAMIGSIGPGANDPNFFKADAQSPCPAAITDLSRVNITEGQSLPVVWGLVVNHNVPPQPYGFIRFNWAAGVPTQNSDFHQIAPPVPIVDQMSGYYFSESVIVSPGDSNGRATLQLFYDIRGAQSPFPAYYQCINFFVVKP